MKILIIIISLILVGILIYIIRKILILRITWNEHKELLFQTKEQIDRLEQILKQITEKITNSEKQITDKITNSETKILDKLNQEFLTEDLNKILKNSKELKLLDENEFKTLLNKLNEIKMDMKKETIKNKNENIID